TTLFAWTALGFVRIGPSVRAVEAADLDRADIRLEHACIHSHPVDGRVFYAHPMGDTAAGTAMVKGQAAVAVHIGCGDIRRAIEPDLVGTVVAPQASGTTADRAIARRHRRWRPGNFEPDGTAAAESPDRGAGPRVAYFLAQSAQRPRSSIVWWLSRKPWLSA